MAVSPIVSDKNHQDQRDKVVTKAQSQAVRGADDGVNGIANVTRAKPELAEQLNEETKNKYVKGLNRQIYLI